MLDRSNDQLLGVPFLCKRETLCQTQFIKSPSGSRGLFTYVVSGGEAGYGSGCLRIIRGYVERS